MMVPKPGLDKTPELIDVFLGIFLVLGICFAPFICAWLIAKCLEKVSTRKTGQIRKAK